MAFTGDIRRDATSTHRRTESPSCLIAKQLCVSAGSSAQLGASGFTPAVDSRQMSTLHGTTACAWVPQPAGSGCGDTQREHREPHCWPRSHATFRKIKYLVLLCSPASPNCFLYTTTCLCLRNPQHPKPPRFRGEDEAPSPSCSSASCHQHQHHEGHPHPSPWVSTKPGDVT